MGTSRVVTSAWLAGAALALLAPGLGAQASPPPGHDPVLDAARNAQARFEDVRRENLPTNRRWVSGSCDVRVGRMCWRYHEVLYWRRQPDPPEVREARDTLLAELERAWRARPGDAWILGERVLYLLEAGRSEEAREVAWSCGGAPLWWCSALEGLALHVRGSYAEAERAFDRALADMDLDEARRWDDPAPLLDGAGRDALDAAEARSAAARDSVVRRIWRAADPLYAVPGNDRRTEHLARRTLTRIQSQAAVPYRAPWGEDMAELVVRYGWERGWEKVAPRPGELGAGVRVIGYQDPDLRAFLPPAHVVAAPDSVRAEPWVPSMSAVAVEGYAPTYAPVFLPMAARILVFPRGERSLVAATFELPPDTTDRTRRGLRTFHFPPPAFDRLPAQAGLELLAADGEGLHATRRYGLDRGVLLLDVPAGAYEASVEVLDPGEGRAGRLRNGLEVPAVPPDVPRLSPLVVTEGESLPGSTEAALERMRVDGRVVAGETLVTGWELWGVGPGDGPLHYRLAVRPAEAGLLDRLGDLLRGGRDLPIVEWDEPAPAARGATFRTTSMAVPILPPGDYVLRLEVTLPGRTPLVSEQPLRVEAPEGDGGGDR